MKNVFLFLLSICLVIIDHSFAQNVVIPDSINKQLINLNSDKRFDLLMRISDEWKAKNAHICLSYAQMAYQESDGLSDSQPKMKAYLAIGKAYGVLAAYDTASYVANRILEKTNQFDKIHYEAKLLLSSVQQVKASYAEAKMNLDNVIDFAVSTGDSALVYDAVSLLASVYTSLGDYPYALNSYQRARTISEGNADTTQMILQSAKIGSMYMRMEVFTSAKEHYDKALRISTHYKNTKAYNTLMSYYGGYWTRVHVFDSAEIYYQKALNATITLGKADDIAGAYLNFGNLLCRQEKFKQGIAKFDTALSLFKEQKLDLNIAKVYNSYSVMYGKRRLVDSSLYYSKKVYEIARRVNNSRLIRSSLYRITAAYDQMGDYKNGMKYAKKFIFYNDSVVGEETRAKVAEMEAKYESAKKENDIIVLKAEKKVQKNKEILLWISLFFILLTFAFIMIAVQQKRKKDKAIFIKEKELAKSELEKSQMQEKELKKEIQYKSKQLTTHALNMMQKNTIMQEMREELVLLSKKASVENKDSFNRMKMLIKKNLRSEKDWDLFKLYFEEVNKQFYTELAKVNVDLSPNELKICALLKLNMNIKESASVLNVEPDSVKKARYKLRKKLKLKPEDDLAEFISAIG